jgi:Tfp pilus assembly protein PilX
MKLQPLCNIENDLYGFAPVSSRSPVRHGIKQRGVVLFFTLIALLVMSLAAVALIRSVDTSALISGNLAYKQAVIASSDRGIAAAMGQLAAMRDASTVDIDQDASHPLNQTNLAANHGYYSSFNSGLNITDKATWDDITNGSVTVADASGNTVDESGNTVYYIIQRMCRTPDVSKLEADCLVGPKPDAGDPTAVKAAPEVCVGNCGSKGRAAQTRITVRTIGPRNSISYVQGFVY